MKPKVIDLFAGVGGLSLGFENSGFDVVLANEYDPSIAAAYDPACGSGNFLIETYISLRRLENEVVDELNQNIKEEECVTKLMEMYEELAEKESL